MSSKIIGHAFVMFAFLLSVAGYVEPSAMSSAVVAVFSLIAFVLLVWRSHEDWQEGYAAAVFDRSISKLNTKQEQEAGVLLSSGNLYKCGLDGCKCESDSRYRKWDDD